MPSPLRLPLRVVRALIHLVTGGGQTPPPPPRPADRWELQGLDGAAGAGASGAAGHSHDHGHSRDHGHSHDHGPATEAGPAVEAAGPAPLAVVPSATPNPLARKYSTNRTVVDGPRSRSYNAPSEARGDALGEAILAIEGVTGMFATGSFVTVLKTADASWDALDTAVIALLETHLAD